jgi:hypothetical protein|nr:MAG TPA: hypothetical protein [Caudoviricetes sp.]DAZ82091.1 MAG TPA: hypothetical protein [Caudoviricetes sp.]
MCDMAYCIWNNCQGAFAVKNKADSEKFKKDMQKHLDALFNMCNNLSQVY